MSMCTMESISTVVAIFTMVGILGDVLIAAVTNDVGDEGGWTRLEGKWLVVFLVQVMIVK